ncbi:MAG: COX15/CtaA family protein [Chloroflexi bacterium]|nr:COX15/CtaA family protein [Chloroflexota bacterium]
MDSSDRAPDQMTDKTPVFRDRVLLILLVIAVVGVVLQITLGGVVRVTGSGDGCPDWPTCFGKLLPPLDQATIDRLYDGPRSTTPRPHNVLLEYSHRSVGTLLGLTIVASVIRVWMRHKQDRVVAWLSTATLVMIFIVGMLGGAVVLNDLDPAIRTIHLMLAEIVAMLVILALVAARFARYDGPGESSPWIWGRVSSEHRGTLNVAAIAGALTLVALLSGSYAVWKEAGSVCASWPLCGGRIVPESGLTWIHMSHRVLSLLSIVFVLLAGHRARRLEKGSKALRLAAYASALLILAQMLMGAANPWTTFAEWARAGHLSMATLVWVNMVFLVALILRPVPRSVHQETSNTAAGVGPSG